MSDIINKDPNINELKFTKSSIGISEFAYSINKSSNEIIVGEDNLIKVILLDKLIEREKEGNKEVEKIINCINFICVIIQL